MKLTTATIPLATSVRAAAACILAGLATTAGANVLDGAKATQEINRILMLSCEVCIKFNQGGLKKE